MLHSRDFSVEKSVFSDFSVKNRLFYRFFSDFSSDRFFLCFFFSVLAENRFFGNISVEKNDFFVPCRCHILWLCLTLGTLTPCVVDSNDFSNNPVSTHQIKYMSNKLDALGLSTYVSHLTYMLQLEGEC